jgi:hypothetical protein
MKRSKNFVWGLPDEIGKFDPIKWNFWLLYTFKVRNIVFFGKIFVLIGRFGVPIIFF